MKYRKLRIAWSIATALLCVLLSIWWIRSFWCVDMLDYPHGRVGHSVVVSVHGVIAVLVDTKHSNEFLDSELMSMSMSEWLDGSNEVPEQFQFTFGAGKLVFVSPHLVFVLLAFFAGVLPLVNWRVSLRILLIATTLVAVMMGLIVWSR